MQPQCTGRGGTQGRSTQCWCCIIPRGGSHCTPTSQPHAVASPPRTPHLAELGISGVQPMVLAFPCPGSCKPQLLPWVWVCREEERGTAGQERAEGLKTLGGGQNPPPLAGGTNTPVGTGGQRAAPWSCKLLHYGVAGTSPSPAAREQSRVGLGLGESEAPLCPGCSARHQRQPYCASGLCSQPPPAPCLPPGPATQGKARVTRL